MTIERKTVQEIIDGGKPEMFPISIFPNLMGINLCCVKSVTRIEDDEGNLSSVTIDFFEDRMKTRREPD